MEDNSLRNEVLQKLKANAAIMEKKKQQEAAKIQYMKNAQKQYDTDTLGAKELDIVSNERINSEMQAMYKKMRARDEEVAQYVKQAKGQY